MSCQITCRGCRRGPRSEPAKNTGQFTLRLLLQHPGALGAVIHRSERQRTEAATFQLYDGRSRNQLRSSDPEAVLLQDGKPTRQNRTVLLDGGGYDRRLPVRSDSMQTEQQHTGVRTPLPIDEFAEVLVRRDEDRRGLRGATKHFDVRDARI